MAAYLPLFFDTQPFTDAGAPAALYLLYTYQSGTTTNKATYTDATGGTQNSNPITLDASGRCNLWLASGLYSFELKTPAGALVKRWDGVGTANDATASVLSDLALTSNAAKGAGMVGFGSSQAYPEGTAGYKLKEFFSVQDYGAHPSKTAAQNTTAFQAAITAAPSGGTVFIPAGTYALNDELVIPAGKSVSIIGQGKGSSVINGELAAPDSAKSVISYAGTAGNECEGVTIADLTVNARFYGRGIEANYCYPKLTIRDVEVWKPVDDGIYLNECWGASVYDAWVDGDNASVGAGIRILNANAVTLYNPRVYNMKSTVQSRGIYATSCEVFNIYGGNIENCPRGIEVTLVTTFCGPVRISGVYFEPRGMSPWDALQPNDHILISGDTSGRGTVVVDGCLFQAGNAGIPIAFNAVTARNLGALVLIGNTWQKAAYTAGGQGENYFVDADSTVAKVIQQGNQLISTSLGNLNTISTPLLNVSNINDSGTNYDVIGALQTLTVKSASGVPLAAMYRDAVVGGSAGVGNIDIGAREDATVFATGARISAVSDGAWSTTNHGTDLIVYNTPNGSTTLTQRMQFEAGGTVQPGADNTQNFGSGSLRWQTIYAGTGAINTSDERRKEQARPLDDAERRAAGRVKELLRAYKFRDAVEAKGPGARIHFGVIAQEVAAAFAAEGLDATRYALFCHDVWDSQPAVYDEEGTLLRAAREAGDAYGIRYDELLCFMMAAL